MQKETSCTEGRNVPKFSLINKIVCTEELNVSPFSPAPSEYQQQQQKQN